MLFNLSTVISVALLVFGIVEAAPLHGRKHRHTHMQRRSGFGPGYKVTVPTCANWNNKNMNDGPSTVNTPYNLFTGPVSNFPDPKNWVSFEAMFEANRYIMKQSCGWSGWGSDNSDLEIQMIKNFTQMVARESHVDHRAIFAVIMQESNGCVRVPTTNNGVVNPGLMQSHNGAAYNPAAPATTIHQMIIDGTQGTAYGDGLAQLVNSNGNYYAAFRAYNSGSVNQMNLSDGITATACYVSDIANRLMGWTGPERGCHL